METINYHVLPTIETLEGVLLMARIIKSGTFNVKIPKIFDEEYINIIKRAVGGEI